jgi:hypothetical protein
VSFWKSLKLSFLSVYLLCRSLRQRNMGSLESLSRLLWLSEVLLKVILISLVLPCPTKLEEAAPVVRLH